VWNLIDAEEIQERGHCGASLQRQPELPTNQLTDQTTNLPTINQSINKSINK
jgi:hypothetical protein